MKSTDGTRRRFIRIAGTVSIAGIAGCTGGDGGGGEETTTTTEGGEDAEELPEGVSEEEFETGPVPDEYRTATSQAGEDRVPESLVTKESVQFQELSDAVEEGLAEEGHDCASCAEYIPDKNGDGFGACAKVEGYVGPEDWCALWESIEEAEGS